LKRGEEHCCKFMGHNNNNTPPAPPTNNLFYLNQNIILNDKLKIFFSNTDIIICNKKQASYLICNYVEIYPYWKKLSSFRLQKLPYFACQPPLSTVKNGEKD